MSRLDSIRVDVQQYADAMSEYSDIMSDVDDGSLSLGAISDADEVRSDAAIDFADDAYEFISEILPHIDALRVAVGGVDTAAKDVQLNNVVRQARALVDAVTASQGGTEEVTGHAA